MTFFDKKIDELTKDGWVLIPDYPNDSNLYGDRVNTPYIKWSGLKQPLDILTLLDKCKEVSSDCVEVVCGTPSKGLICWDVDTKHKLGFDSVILKDLRELYSDLFDKMLVERTKSGGLHIYYRIDGVGKIFGDGTNGTIEFPRKKDIAHRYTTDDERLIRPDLKQRCFLEFHGESSLSRCYPSVGYSIVSGQCGTLTLDEHSIIYSLCLLYNETIKDDYIKPSTTISGRFEQGASPYEEFDKSPEANKVLEDRGWEVQKNAGKFTWYKKPWKLTSREVGATFNHESRLYKIFTTNASVEVKSYSPSNLWCILDNINKKDLYEKLVARGFGKLNKNIERKIIKSVALSGKPLPPNFSEEGKRELGLEIERLKEKYPYGNFWTSGDLGGWKISREDLYRVAKELGFYKYKGNVVYVSGYIVTEVEHEFFFNKLKEYLISGMKEDYDLDLINCYEAFLQSSGEFTITRLENFDKTLILRSTKWESYKFFNNCYVAVNKDGIEILDYENIEGLIWYKDIKSRDFKLIEESSGILAGTYCQFLRNSVGSIDSYLMKCLGFYAHEYRDEDGYMVIATEKCEKPEDGGGSGKNIFWSLLGLSCTFKSTPAEMINFDNNLLQSWNYQRIFVASDLPKDFNLIFFKDLVTGNATVNKKYINEFDVDVEDMPKFGASTNYSWNSSDGGLKRRVRPIEFTDYYTIRGGVNTAHEGRMFPKDWDNVEYLQFDNFICHCIKEFLNGDCKIEIKELSDSGWIKQFKQSFNHLYDFFSLNIEEWIGLGRVENELIKGEYARYCDAGNIQKRYVYTMTKINLGLAEYCKHRGIELDVDAIYKKNNVSTRGKVFGKKVEEEVPF